MSLYDNEEIRNRVNKIWALVFQNSNTVLKQSKTFGFLLMENGPDPNIHAIVVKLQMFSSVMDILINVGPDAGLEYEQTRLIINAKEQLSRMERVAAALKAGNEEDYNASIDELERQAPF